MPDHTWKCSACDASNPPYTEVCRNCLNPAPAEPEGRKEVAEDTPAPKQSNANPDVKDIVEELYPFKQIKDRGVVVKAFAFVVWTSQFIALLVIIISLDILHMAIAFGVLALLEFVVNWKILHIKRPRFGKAV